MLTLLITPMFAAAGYSLIYLLFGGGLGGAVLIFIVAKNHSIAVEKSVKGNNLEV
jgi:hypothetical protein